MELHRSTIATRRLAGLAALVCGVLLTTVGASSAATTTTRATPTTKATSAPSATINEKALGSGGGAFCDALRANLKDSLTSGISEAMAAGDTAKVKTYYEKTAVESERLIAKAPSPVKEALALKNKQAIALRAVMKKANYDFSKVDRVAMAAATKQDATTKTAQATINTYLSGTCHIDVANLFVGGATLRTTTTKPK